MLIARNGSTAGDKEEDASSGLGGMRGWQSATPERVADGSRSTLEAAGCLRSKPGPYGEWKVVEGIRLALDGCVLGRPSIGLSSMSLHARLWCVSDKSCVAAPENSRVSEQIGLRVP